MSDLPLPVKNGVNPSSIWLPAGDWLYLVDFLCEKFPDVGRDIWLSRMNKQEVVSHLGVVFAPNDKYQAGYRLYYYRELDNELIIPFKHTIIYQDDDLLVVDKPHFLPVIPSGNYLHQTLLVKLRKELQIDDLTPLHRLDRETAGIVLFSKRKQTRGIYHDLFTHRKITKVYQAVAALSGLEFPCVHKSLMVSGEPFYRMKESPGITNTESKISLLKQGQYLALYQLEPVSGKKHQLRVHMASLGIPILNDPLYPDLLAHKESDFSKPLQLLAHSLSFIDPLSGEYRHFCSSRELAFAEK